MLTAVTLALSSSLLLSEPPTAGPQQPTTPQARPMAGAHAGAVVPATPDTSPVVTEAVIDAPLADVWKVFTTDEGLKNLGAAQAKIDFRVGGKMLTHYDPPPKGTLGDAGTIENTIIAFEPERMISFRISHPPESFPFQKSWQSTWSVVTLDPVGPDRTHLRLVMLGYTADEDSQKMRAFFDKGNAFTMKHLKERLDDAGARSRTDKAWSILSSFVGEPWKGCTQVDSEKLCASTTWSFGPHDKSILFVIRLGPDQNRTQPHVQMVLGREAATGAVVFTAVNNLGEVMRGNASLENGSTVRLDCIVGVADGGTDHRVVTYTPAEGNGKEYIQRNYETPAAAAAGKPWVELRCTRSGAGDAPAATETASPPGPAKPQSRGSDPTPLLRRFVGGEWVGEAAMPSGPLLGRVIWEPGVSEGFLVARGYLGGEKGLRPHSLLTCGVDPVTGETRFWNFGDSSDLADGRVWAEKTGDADRLVFDWNQHSPGGKNTALHIVFAFDSPDSYHGRMYASAKDEAAGAKPLIDMLYTRVARAPERFMKSMPPRTAAETGAQAEPTTAAGADPLSPIDLDVLVPAPRKDVWDAYTTGPGWKSFMGTTAKIGLRPGGPFEIWFSDNAPEGQRGSETCTVLACDEPSMLSYSWNAPPKFSYARDSGRHTWVVITLAEAGRDNTRVHLRHLGFAEHAADAPDHAQEWRDVRAYFSNAWPKVLGALRAHFEPRTESVTGAGHRP